jgi:hypothetical protein
MTLVPWCFSPTPPSTRSSRFSEIDGEIELDLATGESLSVLEVVRK